MHQILGIVKEHGTELKLMWVTARFGILVLALLYMLSVGLSQFTSDEASQIRLHLQSAEKQSYQIDDLQVRLKAVEETEKKNDTRLALLEQIDENNRRMIYAIMVPIFILGVDALLRMVTRGFEIRTAAAKKGK